METYMQILGIALSTNFIQSLEWPESEILESKWLGNFILKELYPTLFQIARDPDSTVAQNR